MASHKIMVISCSLKMFTNFFCFEKKVASFENSLKPRTIRKRSPPQNLYEEFSTKSRKESPCLCFLRVKISSYITPIFHQHHNYPADRQKPSIVFMCQFLLKVAILIVLILPVQPMVCVRTKTAEIIDISE